MYKIIHFDSLNSDAVYSNVISSTEKNNFVGKWSLPNNLKCDAIELLSYSFNNNIPNIRSSFNSITFIINDVSYNTITVPENTYVRMSDLIAILNTSCLSLPYFVEFSLNTDDKSKLTISTNQPTLKIQDGVLANNILGYNSSIDTFSFVSPLYVCNCINRFNLSVDNFFCFNLLNVNVENTSQKFKSSFLLPIYVNNGSVNFYNSFSSFEQKLLIPGGQLINEIKYNITDRFGTVLYDYNSLFQISLKFNLN